MPPETLETPVAAPVTTPPVVAAPAAPAAAKPAETAFSRMKTEIGKPPVSKPPVITQKTVPPVEPVKVVPPVKDAPVVPAVTPPAAKASEADEFLKSASPKTQKRFVDLAEERAEAKFQERMKSVKLLTPEIEEKLTAAEKRGTEMETELRQSAIERSPEFKAKFIEQPKAIRAKLGDYAKTWGIPEETLINAVEAGRENRRQLSEVLSSIDEIDRDDVRQLTRDYWKIQEDRKLVLSDFDMAQKKLDEHRLNETKTAVEKLMSVRSEAMKTVVANDFEKTCGHLFTGEDGKELKAKMIAQMEFLQSCNWETMKPQDRALMAASALSFRPIMEANTRLQERIAELEAKLSKEDAVVPALGGRATGAPADEPEKGAFARIREQLAQPR
jgi:hypothetical protein